MKIAVFPGSFDPITNGHINILSRASSLFDKVIVLVAINPEKKARFSLDERVEEIKDAVSQYKNVVVDSTNGLTVEYAKKAGAKYLIRGLRNEKDFEFESQLMLANKALDPEIETIFFVADEDVADISSTKVRNLLKSGQDISQLVPKHLLDTLKQKKH